MALNHPLFLIEKPEVEKKAPSIVSMIKSVKKKGIIDKNIMTDLIDFQRMVRDNIAHRKNPERNKGIQTKKQ